MIQITNLSAFHNQTTAWINAVRGGLERAVVKMMKDAQMFATLQSPVYSGDFASNWNVSWGAPDATFTRGPINPGDGPYPNSFPAPRSAPWGMGKFAAGAPKLGQSAFLTNAAVHDEPYAWLIEDNVISFRAGNSGRTRTKTMTHLTSTYGTISKGMLA